MKKKILIVDNDPLILELFTDLLTQDNHEVLKAKDGLSALNLLRTITPDIIFIDLVMPKISGEQLCRIIRNMDRLKDCYLVIISAVFAEKEINYSSLGADAYIIKSPESNIRDQIVSIVEASDRSDRIIPEKSPDGSASDSFARQLNRELLSANQHLEIILESISEGILEIDDGMIIYANSAALLLFSATQETLLGTNFFEQFEEKERIRIESLLKSGPRKSSENHVYEPIGINDRQVVVRSLPIKEKEASTIIMLTDVSEHIRTQDEKRSLEIRLQRAKKMEAIGSLAGGVAHDLNNILAGLVTYPEFLLLDLPDDSPLRDSILTIQKSGEKAAAIVNELLTLARRGVDFSEVLNLNHIITDYFQSLEYKKLISYHPDAEFDLKLDDNLKNIIGSSVQLSKTIMNLVSNAVEAMPDGGKVTITTENITLTEQIAGYDYHIIEGDYSVFKITDSGLGISPTDAERIFEPFYTKKIMGRSGTGLGMSVVWTTVKDHKGYIDVQSEEEKGTTFLIYFPSTEKELKEDTLETDINEYIGNGQSILVIDDMEEQRIIAGSILKKLKYNVNTVSSGEEAIDYLNRNNVDLLIIDMIMDPGMDGLDTYKKVLEINPNQKAILASGIADSDRIREAKKLGATKFIKKPYKIDKLGLAIKDELIG